MTENKIHLSVSFYFKYRCYTSEIPQQSYLPCHDHVYFSHDIAHNIMVSIHSGYIHFFRSFKQPREEEFISYKNKGGCWRTLFIPLSNKVKGFSAECVTLKSLTDIKNLRMRCLRTKL